MTEISKEALAEIISAHMTSMGAHGGLFQGGCESAAQAILDLLQTGQGEKVSSPDSSGGFTGDIWFGHPLNRTMGTHRWTGSEWEELPSELESVMLLLASARTELTSAASRIAELEAQVKASFTPRRPLKEWSAGTATESENAGHFVGKIVFGGVEDVRRFAEWAANVNDDLLSAQQDAGEVGT